MQQKNSPTINTVPAAAALRQVPGFEPSKYVRTTISPQTGRPESKLPLDYKIIWFNLACPDGKILLHPLHITDQMAMFEAQLYLSKNDPEPVSSFTSVVEAQNSGSRYIQSAQDEALERALDNAGFGIQFAAVDEDKGCAEETETPQTMNVASGTVQAAQESKKAAVPIAASDITATEPVKPSPAQTETGSSAENSLTEQLPAGKAPVPSEEHAQKLPDSPQKQSTASPPFNILQRLAVTDEKAVPLTVEKDDGVGKEQMEISSRAEICPIAERTEVGGNFTVDMTVDEIAARMTVEQAKSITVGFGFCKGLTLGQVMERRASSLKFFIYASTEADNVLKAASTVLLREISQRRAG